MSQSEGEKKEKRSTYQMMIEGNIPQVIVMLSIPAILSMLVTNIYNIVDTAFVGRLGTSASGAVGIVFGFMAIIQAFGFMFGHGSGNMMARSLGARNVEEASRIASTGFCCSLLSGLAIEIVGFLTLDRLVFWLGSTPTIAPYAKIYISYILAAAPFMTASLSLNNMLRYEGRAGLGMIGLMTGAFLNMAGDPLFMFGLDMGIAGAGLSTALSQTISFAILLSMFLRGKTESRISWSYCGLTDGRLVWDIMGTGMPSMLRQGLNSCSTVLLNSYSSVYGDAAVAAMSIVSRIVFFVFSISLGMGQGFQPVSGFNYGAKKYKRLRQAYRFTIMVSEAIITVGVALLLIFSPHLIGLFRNDPEVIAVGTRALQLQGLALLALPPCMASEMLYQSTGNKKGAWILSSLRSGLFFIPLLIILANIRGLAGIQEAQPLSTLLAFIPSVLMGRSFFARLPEADEDSQQT